ncbi:ATP-binding protein [Roseateles sp. DC23W]|uniref:histidine kinase n=1 Tax=Pelomonas dachongensis TaxID=3299029 RepID=A0ABW7ENK5_9BURK
MSLPFPPVEPVTLDNCEREPIHIPGSIQPHGALLAFDRLGRLMVMSANANALLGLELTPGRAPRVADLGGDADVYAAVQQAVTSLGSGDSMPDSREVSLNGHDFDLVLHAHAGLCLCEFELRDASADRLSSFARMAYRSMDKLKRQPGIDRLLEVAVAEVRAMTGFDRVMAYRFRHDDSGDIVAEARRDDLEAYVGRRYPASDIPAQARRLYVLNTLRLIPDVRYQPVLLLADAGHVEPVDLSHSVLRSVSPIHVEYLTNMGVAASMSVSIVVGGRLWGMLACHHMAPLAVPYAIRMAADVIAQLLAASVQSLAAREREAVMARAALLRTDIAAQIVQGREAQDVLAQEAPALCESLDCDALIVGLNGRVRLHGPVDEAWAARLLTWLQARDRALVHVDRCDELPESDGPERYCGLLALRFDAPRQGWLVALRREQIETIRWGGKPEKELMHGPLGPRLTPRGSFAEWRETVRGTAVPWSDVALETATLLLDTVSRVHADRVLELDRLRSQLWAVLGHDLRDPLHTLSVASIVLDRQNAADRITTVIRNSTNRMQRLLRDLQDITRLQNGLGLALEAEDTDLAALLAQQLEDHRATYPDTPLDVSLPATLPARLDQMRLLQMSANLLSNARHHGSGRIGVQLTGNAGHARLRVSNPAEPIAPELVDGLFDPFKRQSISNPRNPGSMGLGLYIVDQVAAAHGGSIRYAYEDGEVVFVLELPLAPPG